MNELTMTADSLRDVLRRTWWIPLVQGIAALVVGLLLLTRPAPTLVALTIFLGAYWFVGGVFGGLGAISRRSSDRHWLFALTAGVLGAFAGLLLLAQPVLGALITSLVAVTVLAASAILSGICSVVWAIRVRREIHGEGWIILVGVLSILLGLVLLATPMLSAIALVPVAATLAIFGGAAGVITAFRLRRLLAGES